MLLRALGDLPVYERALEDQGLLTMSVGGRGYWGRQVVRDLCAWLAALANPRDEAALYGVLASPLVGLSSDALALVARAGGRATRGGRSPDDGELRGAPARRRPRAPRRLRGALRRRARARAAPGARRAAAPRRRRDRLRPARPVARRRRAAAGERPQAAAPRRRVRARPRPRRARPRRPRDRRARGRGARDRRAGRARRRQGRAAHVDPRREGPRVPRRLRRRPRPPAPGRRRRGPARRRGRGRAAARRPRRLERAGARLRARCATAPGARAAREEERVMYVATTRAQERLIVSGGVPLADVAGGGRQGAAAGLARARRCSAATCARCRAIEDPIADVAWGDGARVRCVVNTPADRRPRAARGRAGAGGRAPAARAAAAAAARPCPSRPAPRPRRARCRTRALAAWQRVRLPLLPAARARPARRAAPTARPRRDAGSAPAAGLDPRTRGSLVHALLEHARRRPSPRWRRAGACELARRTSTPTSCASRAAFARLAAARGASSAPRSVQREHALHRRARRHAADRRRRRARAGARRRSSSSTTRPTRSTRRPTSRPTSSEHYGVQRRVYALAALRGGAPRVEVAYAFLERPRRAGRRALRGRRRRRRSRRELRALAAGLLAGEYPGRRRCRTASCALTCPGRRALCSLRRGADAAPARRRRDPA